MGRSLKFRCQQGGFLLKAQRENLFHASLLVSGICWQSLAILGNPWHSVASGPITTAYVSIITCPSFLCLLCVSKSPFPHKDMSPTPVWTLLILTFYWKFHQSSWATERKKRHPYWGKKGVKLPLFENDMFKYSNILRNPLKICWVYEFNKVAECKINIQKLMVFIYTCNE